MTTRPRTTRRRRARSKHSWRPRWIRAPAKVPLRHHIRDHVLLGPGCRCTPMTSRHRRVQPPRRASSVPAPRSGLDYGDVEASTPYLARRKLQLVDGMGGSARTHPMVSSCCTSQHKISWWYASLVLIAGVHGGGSTVAACSMFISLFQANAAQFNLPVAL